ncbi:hypothetical protein GCM10007301_48900 [Azorhizobium oxalatiphilum]|uniref:Uncharacterized protein n=1 Tax=Azorhizobium oxalatiphilum TaxID=980631 RepID=A0A917CBC1_9HYPH|nr:hypothetical protein GCM10007301_48900 [Azorhizobium oxalatiphilum]
MAWASVRPPPPVSAAATTTEASMAETRGEKRIRRAPAKFRKAGRPACAHGAECSLTLAIRLGEGSVKNGADCDRAEMRLP